MNKVVVVLVVLGLALLGYLAAGPFLTINAMRKAVETQNSAELSKHIDFPVLRRNLKVQVDDYVVRQAGPDVQSHPFGSIAVQIASGVAGGAVDALTTPAGVGAMMEGRGVLHRITGGGIDRNDSVAHEPPDDPMEGASYGFESASRFTATVQDPAGNPTVFVLTRNGLAWRLTDIRLPLSEPTGAD
ncbi:DUF2939 domain-containing protein [Lysobacter sp. A3-1-A15]|uniref:DUF2939 domain-containing protein n=1 Tax=Novilysobacter viscosus TaxID=3098602 RepID=UPI002ED7B8DA